MRDPQPFEARLATALRSYADGMPAGVDPAAMVVATRTHRIAVAPLGRTGRWAVGMAAALGLVGVLLVGLALAPGAPRIKGGTFVPTGSPRHADVQQGVLLADGRVLIVSSDGERQRPPTSEVYDPVAGGFTTVGPVTTAVSGSTLTVVGDGSVLVAGGLALGDGRRIPTFDRSTVWDPSTDQTRTVELATPRSGHVAALLPDGRVLLAGGFGRSDDGSLGSLASAEVWDPRTGTSTPTGPMATSRAMARVATLPDGQVLVYGGKTWTIDPVDDTGSSTPVLGDMELYDPGTGTFSPFRPDPGADAAPVDIIVDQDWAGIGVLRLDLRAGSAVDITPFPRPVLSDDEPTCPAVDSGCLSQFSAVRTTDDRVLFVGGRLWDDDAPQVRPWIEAGTLFDLGSGQAVATGPFVTPRRHPVLVALADGRVLVVGGLDAADSPAPIGSAEIYTPDAAE